MGRGDACEERRTKLKAHSTINELPQQSVALEKYYNLAGQCQAKANAATEKALRMPARTYLEAHRRQVPLDQAYCYQRRYATLGMECIPKHGYYNSKLGPQRAALKSGCLGALAWLEKIVDAMDADEVLLGAHRAAVAALKKREAEEAALKQGMARLQRDRAEREKRKQKQAADAALPPLVRGARVRYKDGSSGSVVECHRDCPEGPYYDVALDGGRVVQAERSNLELIAGKPTAPSAPPPPPVPSAPPLPPVPPPPPPPPAYDSDAVALGATPLPPALLGYEDSVASKITIEEVRSAAERAWGQTQAQGRGRVERLPTFQGRVRDARNLDSTNGCAVIAPLVCQMHIGEKKELTNSDVARVIDDIVPPILAHIRKKHGLGNGAFIIPADVHDYLYDAKAIDHSMFAGVFGGNCLDDEHVAKLLNAFEEVPQSDKAGCAFFFKEHVIAVLRVGKEYHFVDSLGGGDASGMGTRTVCADVEALRVFLRYYVSKKLPPGCVGNAFDEATADFDARVFQAFLWRHAPNK
jgi:hypothetical protein